MEVAEAAKPTPAAEALKAKKASMAAAAAEERMALSLSRASSEAVAKNGAVAAPADGDAVTSRPHSACNTLDTRRGRVMVMVDLSRGAFVAGQCADSGVVAHITFHAA